MKEITTYLNFDGNARQAMEFYHKCLGGELTVKLFSETSCDVPDEAKNGVANAILTKGSTTLLMASDGMPNTPFHAGTNFCVCLHCESLPEIQKLFAALGENGKVTMPLQDMFWNSNFGMLTDRFGVNWMFNYEYPN